MERITPHNVEAEQSVLGSVFVDQGAMKTLVDKLESDDFYTYRHKVIFTAMVELFQETIDIDYTTLANKLETKGLLNDAGGIDYILGLINTVPSIVNLPNYINIVRDKSITRRIMDACRKIIEDGYTNDDAIDFVDNSEKTIFDIAKERRTTDFVKIGEVAEQVIEKTESAKNNQGRLTGLDTGFNQLNDYTLGLQPSELVIIAARPSMGKSAFALNLATNVAKMPQHPYVAFFSLEMGSDQLVSRMLSAESRVHSMNIRTGDLTPSQWQQISLAREQLSSLNVLFDDSGTVKVTDLRQKCRKLAQERKLDLVIVDYLQLLSGTRQENRVQEVSEISRTLKEMARELKIPVVALSQLSRAVERREEKIPMMADLRDSGSIEQDADIVIFMYRDDYYKKQDSKRPDTVDLIIAKNRQGATTTENIVLSFNKQCSYFGNLTRPENSPIGDL
ncbi:replicative DNA helicase [Candidatus Xianfuyuplasma coldseepsis]|uniref:Replicative DNA helicase n=1 Tax=Candidatus Xianfuyuplasma coldseepsis TaxID=2782163 RepID=A0A7L7KRN2_9MOLU|nr:replicative DNA helicase [Xianfuyuplasma coldseepsis]QMS85393.1 replicative DNA helicase [Xianfuyuplasma coldseepsis]